MFDSHIHLDQLEASQIEQIVSDPLLQGVLAVSTDLASAETLLALKQKFPKIQIAAGFHPEQVLIDDKQQQVLFDWIVKNQANLTAIGEVGLPHYLKRQNPKLDYRPYLALLEQFVALSKRLNLPLNLHIVHDDVAIMLDLLEKYQIQHAHFHWFKTDDDSLERFLRTPYFASVTPDILWNLKTQKIAQNLPLDRLLIETDSPWQHESLENASISQQLQAILAQLAKLRTESESTMHTQIRRNYQRLYGVV
ncbi:TatD family hydrolase [Actinobacillus suis]|uniref:Mg-dependent deoxyribonuclease n=2 Tax=Actinobacillus suis TaxID=716 RepID=K0G565_ACTSU|nr:TatD family hydrolase [Actinobacillus suis]AFU19278.1 Mg-dependent deoxyribonuclease [Actinobacillus suis H91-0380]AIJ31417.1 Mg-dependent deoxyribonuclease [Actinobacillus suis ATCC 33415]MCO4166584.1 TatD family hydrolase [Actinobacillus suis]MCO4168149.1 TatD family hydrolase [Actinobacillus suis]MCQ9629572.1 TatD family hydrolase [Actinobacillus suis]